MTAPNVKPDHAGRAGGALAARLVISWALVGLPLAWGVWQVVRKSLDLFR